MIWIRIPAVWMLALLPTLALGCAPQPPTESDGSAEASGREAGAKGACSPLPEGQPSLPGIDSPSGAVDQCLAATRQGLGPQHKPRTHHFDADLQPKFTNRLIGQTSPYLLQHAHNPVNWYPWGEEAFARARTEGKAVLLSVGYSTCHWCHVMERESFEDLEIAAFLNQHFVAIKVDREERPDIDDLYMSAVRSLTGRGGWPMTVVMTPDQEPFFGGTYFPARDGDRGSRKGFLTILGELEVRFRTDRERVVADARRLSQRLQAEARARPPSALPGAEAITKAARSLASSFDPTWGGFGRSKKFPRPSGLQLMLRYYRRTGDPQALHIVTTTLDKMAQGGIHDQLGGGFHRYSVDRRWFVPHFEKMLYDNAQLAVLYLEAWQASGEERFADVARSTLDYVAREMTHGEGGFFSATDADSPGPEGHDEEGLYFTWSPREVQSLLPPLQSRAVVARYGVTARGNFEGRSIFKTNEPLASVAKRLKTSEEELEAQLEAARAPLLAVRAKRAPPLRDEKVLVAWNGLMITAFARAGLALGRADYTEVARRAATFLLERMQDGDLLFRTWRDGARSHRGYLDDYAFFAQGLLDLWEATGEGRWLGAAERLHGVLDRDYLDASNGGYFRTASEAEVLLRRDLPHTDGAVPSGNAVAVANLLRLHEITGKERYRKRGEAVLMAFARPLRSGSSSVTQMLCALDYRLDRPVQVVVAGTKDDPRPEALLASLGSSFVPNRMVALVAAGEDAGSARVPLAVGKGPKGGEPTAYVCREGLCKAPTGDPAELKRQLAEVDALSDPAPKALPRAEDRLPRAWEYDVSSDRHWHPGHSHWHKGQPPSPSKRGR